MHVVIFFSFFIFFFFLSSDATGGGGMQQGGMRLGPWQLATLLAFRYESPTRGWSYDMIIYIHMYCTIHTIHYIT